MSDTPSFADKFALKIMILGFIIVAVGAGVSMTSGEVWTKVAVGVGLGIYIIGRVLQASRKKR